MRFLDENEQHPSLRVHELSGDLTGMCAASASDALRILFVREAEGHKLLIRCSRHYR